MIARENMKIVVTTEEIAALVADMINAELSPDQPITAEQVTIAGYSGKQVAEVDITGMSFGGYLGDYGSECCDDDLTSCGGECPDKSD